MRKVTDGITVIKHSNVDLFNQDDIWQSQITTANKYCDWQAKMELKNHTLPFLGLSNLPKISKASTRGSTPGVTNATT